MGVQGYHRLLAIVTLQNSCLEQELIVPVLEAIVSSPRLISTVGGSIWSAATKPKKEKKLEFDANNKDKNKHMS